MASTRSRYRLLTPTTRSRTAFFNSAAPRHGRHYQHDIAVGQLGVQAVQEPDILVVEVDIHEPVKLSIRREQLPLDAWESPVEIVEQRGDSLPVGMHGFSAPHPPLQQRGHPSLDAH